MGKQNKQENQEIKNADALDKRTKSKVKLYVQISCLIVMALIYTMEVLAVKHYLSLTAGMFGWLVDKGDVWAAATSSSLTLLLPVLFFLSLCFLLFQYHSEK